MKSLATLLSLACLCFAACSKGGDAPASGSSLPSATQAGLEKALASYEEIRELLADDRPNVRMQALELMAATKVALSAAPMSIQQEVQALSSSAGALVAADLSDLKEVRAAFGTLSKAVVALLAAAPSLQKGKHVFECPMAEGYSKWVQVREEVSNPYMGSEMPACGSAAEFW